MREWLFTRERRAVMRAVGQLGVVVVVGQGLMRLGMQAYSCLGTEFCPFSLAGWWVGPLTAVIDGALGLWLLWLTGRESRAGAAVALGWVLLLIPLIWLVVAAVGGGIADGSFLSVYVMALVTNLWTVVPAAMLIASYRGPSLGLDEHSAIGIRSVWLWLIAAVPVLSWAGIWGSGALGIMGAAAVPVLLATCVLYGLGRRLRPLTGAADWLPVTIVMLALALPSYLWGLLESPVLPWGGAQRVGGFSFAVGLLVGLVFRYRRRGQLARREVLEVTR